MSAAVVSRTTSIIMRVGLRRKTSFTSWVRLSCISTITNWLIPFQSSCRYILFLFKKPSAYLRIHQNFNFFIAFSYWTITIWVWNCSDNSKVEEEEENNEKKIEWWEKIYWLFFHFPLSDFSILWVLPYSVCFSLC